MSLFLADGGPAIVGPLARDYLAEMRRRGVIPLDVFMSSAYSCQQSATTSKNFFSFLLADRSERRAIFAELLGLKPYAVREAYCKDKIKALDTLLVGQAGLIRQLEQEALGYPEALGLVAWLETALTDAKATQATLKTALEGLQAATAASKERLAGILPFRTQSDVLGAEIRALLTKRAITEKALADAHADIRVAAEVQDAPHLKEDLAVQRAALLQVKAQADDLNKEIGRIEAEVLEITENLKRDVDLLAEEEAILASVDRLHIVTAEIGALDTEIEQSMNRDAEALSTYNDWLHACDDLKAKRLTLDHLDRQVAIMNTVPCRGVDEYADCQFLGQAMTARERLPDVRVDVSMLEAQVGEPRQAPQPTDRASKTRRAALLMDRGNLAPLASKQVDLASARSRVDGLNDRVVRLGILIDDKRRVADELVIQVAALPTITATLRELEPKVLLAGKLAPAKAIEMQATVTLIELMLTLRDKTSAKTEIDGQLTGLASLTDAIQAGEIEITKTSLALQAADRTASTAERDLGAAQATLTRLEQVQQRLETMAADLLPLQADLGDWTLIARSQGPSGIPALRVDRALPEIGERATSLLKECLGRVIFTIMLTTQKTSADEKKLLETLDVVVLRNGKVMDAALLSGGEGTLVSEALALAIALYNADAGRRSYTLFRDEVGAALDTETAPAYVRLLSRAAKIGGFDKVLLVTHHEAALALADARLKFADSAISIS